MFLFNFPHNSKADIDSKWYKRWYRYILWGDILISITIIFAKNFNISGNQKSGANGNEKSSHYDDGSEGM